MFYQLRLRILRVRGRYPTFLYTHSTYKSRRRRSRGRFGGRGRLLGRGGLPVLYVVERWNEERYVVIFYKIGKVFGGRFSGWGRGRFLGRGLFPMLYVVSVVKHVVVVYEWRVGKIVIVIPVYWAIV